MQLKQSIFIWSTFAFIIFLNELVTWINIYMYYVLQKRSMSTVVKKTSYTFMLNVWWCYGMESQCDFHTLSQITDDNEWMNDAFIFKAFYNWDLHSFILSFLFMLFIVSVLSDNIFECN